MIRPASRPFVVRAATASDIDALVPLWVELAETADLRPNPEAVRARLTNALGLNDRRMLVAVEDHDIVGFVSCTVECVSPVMDGAAVHVTALHVTDPERRHGVGTALMQGVLELAEHEDAAEISVSVPPEMRAANRYLAKLGFAPILVRRSMTTDALKARLVPTQTRTRRAVLQARKAAQQPVTAVARLLQP